MIEEVIKKDLKTVSDIDKDMLSRVSNKEEYHSIMLNYLKRKYPYTTIVSNNIEFELQRGCNDYFDFVSSIEYYDNKFKIYPFTGSKDQKKFYYEKVLEKIINYHLETGISYEEIIKIYTDSYKNEVEKIKSNLKNMQMLPYYGTPSFMLKKAGYILKCASKLTSDIPIDLYNNMMAFLNKYPPYKEFYQETFPYYTEEFKRGYIEFENNYLKILEFEKSLVPLAKKIWEDFLTDPKNHDDNHYAYLAHTFSYGEVDPREINKVCTSLLTEDIQTIGEFGLLFGADNNFDECCSEDAGSWEITKEDFIDRNIPKQWQYPSHESKTIFYEYENISKLLLPQDIVKDVLNGGIVTYSEIVLTGKVHPIGVFFTDICKDVEKVKAYAEKYNLPLIHIGLREKSLYI